jgi:hypothetical protein
VIEFYGEHSVMMSGLTSIALFGAVVALLNVLTMSQGHSAPANPSAYCGEAEAVDIQNTELQEARCLRQLSQWASRKGNTLQLRLDSGTAKPYNSNPKACDKDDASNCVRYYLIGYHARARLFFVWAQFYEAHDLILVSARDGTETDLLNIPHFAPDGLTFVVVDIQPTHQTKYDFAIGSVTTSPPSLTWTRKTHDEEEWEFRRWLDKDKVAVFLTTPNPPGCPEGKCEAVLTRNGKVWKLDITLVPASTGGGSVWSRVPTR